MALDLVLGGASPAGDALREHLTVGESACAPHLIDAEVGQGLRRLDRRGGLAAAEAQSMLGDFLDLPITRYPHRPLLERAFELRANVSVYDGLYLALAEALKAPLLTGDRALDGVPGCLASVVVLTTTA